MNWKSIASIINGPAWIYLYSSTFRKKKLNKIEFSNWISVGIYWWYTIHADGINIEKKTVDKRETCNGSTVLKIKHVYDYPKYILFKGGGERVDWIGCVDVLYVGIECVLD